MVLKMRITVVLLATCALVVAASAAATEKSEPGPRAISSAEAAAVEIVADFFARGPEAFYDRLAPESPLASLSKEDALAEIEVRTGQPDNATWTLQTIVPSLADHAAIFGVEFESAIDDAVQIELVEHDGRFEVVTLRSLSEPSPYAIRPWWIVEAEALPAEVEEQPTLLKHLPFVGVLIALLAITSLAILRMRPALGRIAAAATIVALGAALFLLTREVVTIAEAAAADAAETSESSGIDRLGALLAQRRALASGTTMEPAVGVATRAADIAAIWKAQIELREQKLAEATTTLERFPLATDRPMVALLRARLAASAYDDVATSLAYERAMRLGPGRDELWFETAQWLGALGFEDRAISYLKRLPQMGSRNASAYYTLASVAGADGEDSEARSHLRTAWRLEPVPRSEIIATPALASVMRLEETKFLIPLSSPTEPSFRTDGDPSAYIDLPDSTSVTVTGNAATITVGGNRTLVVSGGGTLVGPEAEVLDAVSMRKREEERSLEDFEQLLAFRGSPSAMANPVVRERFVQTASALANRDRWADLDRLTAQLSASAESVPPDLLFLRGAALRKLHRDSEVKRLLAEMVASPAMERRSDPRILYQFGEMLAAMELYAPAIRALERVDAMVEDVSFDDRIRQLSMNQRLAERYNEHVTPNFVFHYPDDLRDEHVERLASVMESELTRLRKIIPLSGFQRTTINVLWWSEFRNTYTGSDHILGFYDGKITLPLAGISSVNPAVVSLMTHELAHAVIAQATNDRAAAWIQEGLAQRVEMVPYHANAFNMYDEYRMLPISLLNATLQDSIDGDMIGQAYITSQTVIRFLESKYGAKAVPSLLDRLRTGESEEEALTGLTGKTIDELEIEFRDWGRSKNRVFENRDIVRYDTTREPAVRFSKEKQRR